MENRISMVAFKSLVELYKADTDPVNSPEFVKHLDQAYDQGMSEVLREIAMTELLKYEATEQNIVIDSEADREETEAFKRAMHLCNTRAQRTALLKVDSAYNHCAALRGEHLFIEGFMRGYKFLKELGCLSPPE